MLAGASAAGHPRRNADADLVNIATRFVAKYTTVQHQAGDQDGIFIEDVVIPSVVDVASRYGRHIPSAMRQGLHQFLVAGDSLSSEELAGLARHIYENSPAQFCRDISGLSAEDKKILLRQVGAGFGLTDSRPAKKPYCK